jgi:thioesterase domain-containing protein/acyl carrier protein
LVLDAHGNLAPFGVAGELVLGGVQLARGYLHQAALSAERFVPDLLSGPGARMYKTGDLARMHEDGSIDCLGRIDEQVKIRGFRIEPGEIETVLAACAGVREVAVIAREDAPGDKRLVAYLAAEPIPDQQQLRAHLLRSLPDYMVPAHFVALETLPLTANGKLDRRALPAPDLALAGGRGGAPRSALEAELAQLWAELLGRELVGIDDNFFELGGHSLLVMLLVSRIEQRWGRKVPVAQLFQTPTIGALAAVLEQADTGGLLLPLREGGADAALFLVHAGGGDAQCYADLAQALPAGRAVYGIQSPDAAGLRIEPYERAVVCNAYADAIVAQQPHGPYVVGGWSLGGTLALEVAGILEGRGHLVAAVMLLDTMRKVDAAAQRFELDTYLDHVLLYGEADFTNTFSKALLPLRERLAALAAGQGTLHIAQMLASHDPALETQWGFRPEWQKVFVDNFKTMQRHASLARGFHPPTLRAPVHSFWAQLSIERGAEVGAWVQASTNAHSSAQVLPGSHLTLIYGASATLLASRLDAVLPATVSSTLLEI